jgi:hypothetical protein
MNVQVYMPADTPSITIFLWAYAGLTIVRIIVALRGSVLTPAPSRSSSS